MIPKGAEAIRHIITRIRQDVLPTLQDAYTASDVRFMTLMLEMVAQDYDRAADVANAAYEGMRPILTTAAERLEDAGLKARIAEALALRSPSLKVSDLTARTDAAMRVLIDVQAAVEDAEAAGAAWARELAGEIWRYLEAHAAAQAYDLPI